MFDIDSGKLLIVAVLALIVIGPKELPRVLRQVGQAVGKVRRMAGEFQGQFMDAMKEADIADIRKELDDLNKSTALDVHFDPARDIQAELTGAMAPLTSTVEAEVPAPAAGFELPAAPEDAELGSSAAGIAPLAAPEPVTTIEVEPAHIGLNGSASPSDVVLPPKRRILVKRRTSRLNIQLTEAAMQRTGAPFVVRRRVVRAKPDMSDGLPIA